MMLKNGKWVVYDVLIENVSLIKNYRSQFQDVLTRGTPEQLIEKVEAGPESFRPNPPSINGLFHDCGAMFFPNMEDVSVCRRCAFSGGVCGKT